MVATNELGRLREGARCDQRDAAQVKGSAGLQARANVRRLDCCCEKLGSRPSYAAQLCNCYPCLHSAFMIASERLCPVDFAGGWRAALRGQLSNPAA